MAETIDPTENIGSMPDENATEWELRFEQDGKLTIKRKFVCSHAPHLVHMGNGVIWQFNRQTWNRETGYTGYYKIARIVEL